MRKILSITIILYMMITTTIFAEDVSIDDIINELWLDPTVDSGVINNIREENNKKMQEDIDLYLIASGTYRQKIGISADDEKMKEQVRKNYEVFPNNILKIYFLDHNSYAAQYANSKCLDYLISDDYFLRMEGYDYKINDYDGTETIRDWPRRYGSNGTTEGYEQLIGKYGYSGGMSDGSYEFIKNSNNIKNLLLQNNISNVEEMKVVITGKESTCLYIKSLDNEYLIRLYTGQYYNIEQNNPYEDWVDELELFKLYSAKDFFNTVSTEMNEMNKIKPTYETEALALQADGLIQGNENGLDLLKPLTRIEATAVLVRAMGFEDTSTSETSYFSDIPSDNWGAKYANIACDKGIATGVGDNLFAPNDTITASQFATLILRNTGENPDWQTAINTFVDKGLITSEQAQNMDLFTRGDMAKLIYEAKQNGLL